MQLVKILAGVSVFASTAFSFTAKQPYFTFATSKKESLALHPITKGFEKQSSPVVIDIANENLEFDFSVDSSEVPERVTLLLGSREHNVETSYEPVVRSSDDLVLYKFKVPVSRIPSSLLYFATLEQEPLYVSLILASEGAGDSNVFVELLDLKLDFESGEDLKLPERFGSKPEIHHIFNGSPKTVSPWLAQFFCLVIAASLFGLLSTWAMSGAIGFDSLPSGMNLIYLLGFVGALIGLEYIFTQYYLGASIFVTLGNTLYLSIPGIWLGSRVLRYLTKRA